MDRISHQKNPRSSLNAPFFSPGKNIQLQHRGGQTRKAKDSLIFSFQIPAFTFFSFSQKSRPEQDKSAYFLAFRGSQLETFPVKISNTNIYLSTWQDAIVRWEGVLP
jgi:hypothetical protein